MKKLFYILTLSAFCLTACYEDKGNYDYNPIPEIELTGLESEYTVYAMDTLDVVPQFAEKENSDCVWTLFLNGLPQAKVDTLSTEPDLHYRITEKSGSYTLGLTIENRKTGDRQIFKSTVTVHTQYSAGCYILKEVEGNTDIDLITLDHKLVADILDGKQTRLEGTPRSFTTCSDINYVDEQGEAQERVNTVWICSDRDARMLALENMTPVYDIRTMFFDEHSGEYPRNLLYNGNLVYYSNKGCYSLAVLVPTAMHKFGLPLEVYNASGDHAKDCVCSSVMINNTYYIMSYDEQNQRFLAYKNGRLYHFTDKNKYGYPTLSPNNMNSDLLYMCKAQNGYALMYDKTTQDYVLYKLEVDAFNIAMTPEFYSPLLERTVLATDTKIMQGETYGHNQMIPYIYFSIGNTLNLFDCVGMRSYENILPGLEGKITLIKHIQGTNTAGERYEYLVVATSQNGRYKLYFCEMLAGRPDLSKTPKMMEGVGTPKYIYIIN